jgi:ATP-dependent RNA helicase DDX20
VAWPGPTGRVTTLTMPRAERVRSEDVTLDEELTFSDLQLPEALVRGLGKCGLHVPSPVQRAAIPLGRMGADLVVQAKSGTGKTITFGCILLQRVDRLCQQSQALVVAPTREVAQQSHDALKELAKHCELQPPMTLLTCLGGLPVATDRTRLATKPHVIVGTPGRLRQLMEEGSLVTENITMFVIDEADLLMTGSFERDVLFIHSMLPDTKQVMAFSATYPPEVVERVNGFVKTPHKVQMCTQNTNALKAVRQFYVRVDCDDAGTGKQSAESTTHLPEAEGDDDTVVNPSINSSINSRKEKALLTLFSKIAYHQCVVFVRRPERGVFVTKLLRQNGTPAVFISGTCQQSERQHVMSTMRSFQSRVLVSTDLTARGVDLERVNLVVHLDVPRDKETYSHRVGRSGRFGTNGLSVLLVTESELLGLRTMLTSGGEVVTEGTTKDTELADTLRTSHLSPLPEVVPADWYAYDLDDADVVKAEALRLEGELGAAAAAREDAMEDHEHEEEYFEEEEECFEEEEEGNFEEQDDPVWHQRREWASWWWWYWKDMEEARGRRAEKAPWFVPPVPFGRARYVPQGGYR